MSNLVNSMLNGRRNFAQRQIAQVRPATEPQIEKIEKLCLLLHVTAPSKEGLTVDKASNYISILSKKLPMGKDEKYGIMNLERFGIIPVNSFPENATMFEANELIYKNRDIVAVLSENSCTIKQACTIMNLRRQLEQPVGEITEYANIGFEEASDIIAQLSSEVKFMQNTSFIDGDSDVSRTQEIESYQNLSLSEMEYDNKKRLLFAINAVAGQSSEDNVPDNKIDSIIDDTIKFVITFHLATYKQIEAMVQDIMKPASKKSKKATN